MKNDLKFQIIAILNPPKGVIYPTMPMEDLLLDLFKRWALGMVGEWTKPKYVGDNHRNALKAELRQKIEESTK